MTSRLSSGGLPAHAAARMRTVFAMHPNIETVVLFGSRAKGNHMPASDIDLALLGRVGFGEMAKTNEELDDLLLPWEIDLLQLDSISNQDLRKHIAGVGQIFYTRVEKAE